MDITVIIGELKKAILVAYDFYYFNGNCTSLPKEFFKTNIEIMSKKLSEFDQIDEFYKKFQDNKEKVRLKFILKGIKYSEI